MERLPKQPKEVVLYALVKNSQVLLAQRLQSEDFWHNQTIIPGGKIESEDHYTDQTDYKENALFRELDEELGIKPTQYRHIFTRQYAEEQNDMLHFYLITNWDGAIIPKEPNKEKFIWLDIHQVHEQTPWRSVRELLHEIMKLRDLAVAVSSQLHS